MRGNGQSPHHDELLGACNCASIRHDIVHSTVHTMHSGSFTCHKHYAFIAQCLSISQCSTMHVLIAPYKLCANVPLFIHLYTILSGKIKWQVLRNLLDIFEVDSQRIILLPLLKIIKKDFTEDVNVNATKWFGVII